MILRRLSKKDIELVDDARLLIRRRRNRKSRVAASLRTKSGSIWNGINIEIRECAPCSICAEYAAIAKMFTDADDEIEAIVAVSLKKGRYSVLPPCGKCRQFMSAFGNPYVILEVKGKLKKARLSDITLFQYAG
ncbi:MAG: hypothetical protein OEW04_07340 [Nitrospirota bacterium]|nr:hypothetical protein [Nitrospirota bacterium]